MNEQHCNLLSFHPPFTAQSRRNEPNSYCQECIHTLSLHELAQLLDPSLLFCHLQCTLRVDSMIIYRNFFIDRSKLI